MAKRRAKAPARPRARRDALPQGKAETLKVFPFALRPGDGHTDDEGKEWVVLDNPESYKSGKMVMVRFGQPGDPSALWEHAWPAHQKVTIRRPTR
jgi:hypothetical protein